MLFHFHISPLFVARVAIGIIMMCVAGIGDMSGAPKSAFSVCVGVADSIGEPEIYATVRVYSASDSVKPAVLGTTDDEGRFDHALPSAGDYRLTVVSVGKKPVELTFGVNASSPRADLGMVTTEDNATELGQVEVVAQRPLVVREIDRLGYDVKADPESDTSTLREILRKVPLVSVDNEGNIKVKGSSDFKIYKNGRPNNSYTKNAKDIFAAIPASSIKKIEVITEPGAREDAEGVGAILNIVTDAETSMKGVVGTVNLYCDNNSFIPNPSLWLSTQVDKVTLSVNGGYNRTPKGADSKGESSQWMDYYDSGNRYESDSRFNSPQNSGWWGLEGSWEPDTLNLITVDANGWVWSALDQVSGADVRMLGPVKADGSRDVIYSYGSTSRPKVSRYFDFDGSVNYQRSTRRKGETFTLSYNISTTDQKNESETLYHDMVNCGFGYTGIYYDSDRDFIEHTVQADWSRPFGDRHKLDVGAKGVFRRNHSVSAQEYYGADMDMYDDFTHVTTIGAVYADYRLTLGKWSVRAGLRYEYSHLSASFAAQTLEHPDFSSDLNDWVPNVALSWNMNDANALKVSYGRSIRRPGISFLDPSRSESPTSVSYGNPDLESVAYNNVNVNYSFIRNNFNMDVNLGGTIVDNSLQNVQWLDDMERTVNTYDNVGKLRSLNLSVYFQWTIDSKTRWMMNLWGGYTYIRQPVAMDAAGGQVYGSRGRWAVNPWTRISRDLPWKLELSLSGSWWSGGLSNVYSYSGGSRPTYSLGLVRKFLKDDRLTVRLTATRPFGPVENRFRSYTYNPQYRSESLSTNRNARYFGISLNYRFGSLNAQVKKTAARINNDDLEGRKK